MIERQIAGRWGFTAVLTRVIITRVNVRARKGDGIEAALDPNVAQ